MSEEITENGGVVTVISKNKDGATVRVTGHGMQTSAEADSVGEARIIGREEAERIMAEARHQKKRKKGNKAHRMR